MKQYRKVILLLMLIPLLMAGGKSWSQKTLVDVKLEPAAILIGEQTILNITVTTDRDKDVRLMLPRDTLMRGVEILAISHPDSTKIENDRLLIKHDLLITSFDSSLYLLPPVIVLDGTDTISSNQVALKVSTIPVNLDEPDEFYDIKSVWKPPFVLADYYPIIFGIWFGILLVTVIILLIQRLRAKKSLIPFRKQEPKLPPHVVAIQELDQIKHQKLWQQGRNKDYYTQITETLRKYIVDQFGINAMEMTTAEILDIINKNTEAESVYENLKQILVLSDFVKFAKWNPLPDENDLSMMNAYLFVNQTKPTEPLKPEEMNESETEKKSSNDMNENKQ